jgi:diguanylate cyclase (GGDEF)-like protein
MKTEIDDLVKLAYFADIAKGITSASSVSETLQQVQRSIGTIFAPRNWSILLTDPKSGGLRFQTVAGEGSEKLTGQLIPAGRGIAGWIAENALPVIVEDVARDERFDPSMDELIGFTTKSIIGVPLLNGGRLFGVIELINKLDGTSFSPLELKILVTIADFAAIAIEKAYYTAALKRIAVTDPLTGVLNRRGLERALDREIARCKRKELPISILMFDIDNFKGINDTHGHLKGDEVLKDFAEILKKNIRKADILCRYGGDEFAVIMPEAVTENAEYVKKRVTAHLALVNDRREFPFAVSIGIHSGTPDSVPDVFDSADKALYFEKTRKIESDIDNLSTNLSEFLV